MVSTESAGSFTDVTGSHLQEQVILVCSGLCLSTLHLESSLRVLRFSALWQEVYDRDGHGLCSSLRSLSE